MLSLLIFLAVAVLGAFYLFLTWHLVGLYGDEVALSRAIGKAWRIRDLCRLEAADEIPGFMDTIGVTHTRFYTAVLELAEPLEIRLVRYFPDAYGRPWGSRLAGRGIAWQPRPRSFGFLWNDHCFVLRPWGLIGGASLNDPLS